MLNQYISYKQMDKTIKEAFELSGVGLHSGVTTTVRVMPAEPDAGRYFVRVDLPDKPIIPASVEVVSQTTLSTELARGEAKVRTVEHLLAALAASGVENARIEIDGAEVPLLDGSAKMWIDEIAPIPSASSAPPRLCPPAPIWIREDDSFVAALPASETRFTYGIDFPYEAIGNQWHSWSIAEGNFAQAIAPARTFGFAENIEQLRKAGLIRGGSLDNALICSRDGWLNPPLRFTNEPARHKLLDLVGDISLLGKIPQAHFVAYKASHKLHIQLAQQLARLTQN